VREQLAVDRYTWSIIYDAVLFTSVPNYVDVSNGCWGFFLDTWEYFKEFGFFLGVEGGYNFWCMNGI